MAPLSRLCRGSDKRHMAPRNDQPEKIEGENVVVMATFPTLDSIACTINASRLIDTYGEQAAYQQRTINKVAGQGTMIKITIPIYEVTA